MADITKLSNEELLGLSSQPSTDISTLSDQELLRAKPVARPGRSPLSIFQRGRFAFGDEPGREAFLKRTFPGREISQLPTGKFAIDGTPVDPSGFRLTDIPGDIADIADELVRIGGQIKGATIGTAVGAGVGLPTGPGAVATATAGTIIGGAAGRVAGQLSVEAIGRGLGLRQNELIDVAREIRNEGLLGAAGEAGGVVIKGITKAGAKFLNNLFSKINNKISKPAAQTLFNFTAGIEKSSIQRLQERGAREVLTVENMSDDALLKLVNKIQGGVKSIRQKLGKQVGIAKKALKTDPSKKVRIDLIKSNFDRQLLDADILTSKIVKGKQVLSPAPQAVLPFIPPRPRPAIKITKVQKPLIEGIDTARNKLLSIRDTLLQHKGKNIPAKTAIRLKDELDDIAKFGREGKLVIGTNENRIIKELSEDLGRSLDLASESLRIANANFADVARTEDTLRTQLSLPRGETFIRNVLKEKSAEFPKQKLIELDNLLPLKDKFFNKLQDVVAAQEFRSSTFRGIRTGIFGAALGAFSGGAVPAIGGLGAGIAVSTPRTVGSLFGGQQAIGRGIETGFRKFGEFAPVIAPKLSGFLRNLGVFQPQQEEQ